MDDTFAKECWPSDNGAIAGIIRAYDWTSSPLGPTGLWSQSLRTTVDLMLAAQAQIVLFCGPEFVALYNDAYAPTIGDKHPSALGRPAHENWGELWDDLRPLLTGVLETGKTFAAKDRPFYIERAGSVGETVYFDISYSAVRGTDSRVEAVLCIVSETTERVLATARLRESEERFRALVNASSDVVYRMSPDWQEMRQLDGRALLADSGSPSVRWKEACLFPEDRPEIEAVIDKAIEDARPFSLDHRVRRADGSEGWTSSRAIPVFDPDGGIVEWFGMAADITARKDSERRIRLLMREVNHRVKNQFAVILSMVRATRNKTQDPKEFEERIRERIMSLSRSHDLLVATDWNGADIFDLMREQLGPFGHEDQVVLSGQRFILQANAVQNIGMALHELATNSVKYGALSGPTGMIAVSWTLRATADNGVVFELTWDERLQRRAEPPFPTPIVPGGFGSVVLERVAPESLSGRASLAREATGVRWCLSVPAANVVATPGTGHTSPKRPS